MTWDLCFIIERLEAEKKRVLKLENTIKKKDTQLINAFKRVSALKERLAEVPQPMHPLLPALALLSRFGTCRDWSIFKSGIQQRFHRGQLG